MTPIQLSVRQSCFEYSGKGIRLAHRDGLAGFTGSDGEHRVEATVVGAVGGDDNANEVFFVNGDGVGLVVVDALNDVAAGVFTDDAVGDVAAVGFAIDEGHTLLDVVVGNGLHDDGSVGSVEWFHRAADAPESRAAFVGGGGFGELHLFALLDDRGCRGKRGDLGEKT